MLTRKMLKEMGLDSEQIDKIIAEHTDSTEAIKDERDKVKAMLVENEKALKTSKEELAKASDESPYKAKYETVKKEFDDYKEKLTKDKVESEKKLAYTELLKAKNIDPRRFNAILKVTDLDKIELVDGKIKDNDLLLKDIETNWSDFKITTDQNGADTKTPPNTNTEPLDVSKMDMAQYIDAREKGLIK